MHPQPIFQPAAVLRTPTWYGGRPDETFLDLLPHEYEVQHHGDRSTVRAVASGVVVYDGIGPAEVISPDVPF